MMDLFIQVLPVVIAINLLLGVIVLMTHMRRLANRVFAAQSLVIALWLACQYFGSVTASEAWLAFWIRQSCAASLFMLLFFHLLRGAVAQTEESFRDLVRRSWPWIAATVGVALLCQTRFFLEGARLPARPGALAEPLYGPGFIVFVGFWIVAVSALVWYFSRSMAHAEGVRRLELQVMALGSVFALVPGVGVILIVPLLTGSSQSARITPLTVLTWHSVIAYGIATRHIMGIGEFLRRTVTGLLLVGLLAALYTLGYLAVLRLPLAEPLRQTAAHVAAAVAVALALAPTNRFLMDRADRLFDEGRGELSRLLRRGGALARSITTADALIDSFCGLLQESLGLSWVRAYLLDGARFTAQVSLGACAGEVALEGAEPLIQVLRDTRGALLRHVLQRAGGSQEEGEAERGLARLGAEAAVALRSSGGLIGVLLLGRRQKGRVFGRREEDALTLLGDQIGIALENALLYTRLRDARRYDEVLLDNLTTGVIAADAGGRLTVCNREAQRILRLPALAPETAGGAAAARLPEPLGPLLANCLAGGEAVRDRDLVLWPGTPEEQPARVAAAAFGGAGQAASGVLLVVQDTSALRRLEEQIRRSDRLASIGTLAAGMAHEIKNPLVCIKTFVQLLPTQYDNPDFRATFAPLLEKEVERINATVSNVLNFSRPVKPMLVPLSLHASLDAACQLVSQPVKAKGLALARRFEAGRDRLLGDQRLLGQVFLNLLLNGIDATECGGALTVSTAAAEPPELARRQGAPEAEGWIEVRVCDTGRGVALDDRVRIFDPFFTTKSNGTGLGLSVAHGIVLEHRGLIDVESVPGQGSCFRVLLPLLGSEDPGAACAGEEGPA